MGNADPPALTRGQQEVDTRLAELEETCRQIQLEKYTLFRRRNAAAPINRLPDECLSLIFIMVLEEGRARLGTDNFPMANYNESFRKVPVVLLSVSARWQALALGTPRMWSCLEFSLGAKRLSHPDYLSTLTERIERTKSVPVSIELDMNNAAMPNYVHQAITRSPFGIELDVIAPTFRRCQRLRIRMPWNREEYVSICKALLTNMPVLEDLGISDNTHPRRKTPLPLEVTTLKSLQLYSIDVPYFTPSQAANITTLSLSRSSIRITEVGPDPGAFPVGSDRLAPPQPENPPSHIPYVLLQHATNLKDLSLVDVSISGWEDQDLPVITCGGLTRLKVACNSLSDHEIDNPDGSAAFRWISKMFSGIFMPRLCDFTLSGYALHETDCGIIFTSLAHFRPPLESLHLEHVRFNSAAILDLLANFPQLTSFSLTNTYVTEELIKGLTPRDTSDRVFCTKLTDLRIIRALEGASILRNGRDFTMPTLLEFVKSRKLSPSSCAISSLFLDEFPIHITEEVFQQFKDNVASLKFKGFSQWTPWALGEPSDGSEVADEDALAYEDYDDFLDEDDDVSDEDWGEDVEDLDEDYSPS